STQGLAIDPSSGTVYLGGDNVRRSSDSGLTWTSSTGLPASYVFGGITVDPVTPTRVYACSSSYSLCYASSDGGASWLPMPHGGARIIVDPGAHNTLYLSGGYDGPWKSRDGGTSWTQIVVPYSAYFDLAIAPSNTQELYLQVTGTIY